MRTRSRFPSKQRLSLFFFLSFTAVPKGGRRAGFIGDFVSSDPLSARKRPQPNSPNNIFAHHAWFAWRFLSAQWGEREQHVTCRLNFSSFSLTTTFANVRIPSSCCCAVRPACFCEMGRPAATDGRPTTPKRGGGREKEFVAQIFIDAQKK